MALTESGVFSTSLRVPCFGTTLLSGLKSSKGRKRYNAPDEHRQEHPLLDEDAGLSSSAKRTECSGGRHSQGISGTGIYRHQS